MLSLKPSQKSKKGRELDDSKFNSGERDAYDKADAAQWEKHLKLNAAEVISPEEAAVIWRDHPETILPVPSRFVRTNAAEDTELVAKSRLVVPGYLLKKVWTPEKSGRIARPLD